MNETDRKPREQEKAENEIKRVVSYLVETAYKTSVEEYKKAAREIGTESITHLMELKSAELGKIAAGYAVLSVANGDGIRNPSYVANLTCLLRHYQLLMDILTNLFETVEGRSCCMDKARTVLDYLIRKFSGKPTPNLKENEFNNPKTILREEWEILEFFEAFKLLTRGDPEKFAETIRRLKETPAARDEEGEEK